MSTPQAKRRRLDDASRTLHKPFRSPFRTPIKPSIGSVTPSSGLVDSYVVLAAPTISAPVTASSPAEACSINAAEPRLSRSCSATPIRRSQMKTSSRPKMSREIIELRNDIQILTQAHTLAMSTKEDDMLILIGRWRTASRAAAEELFAGTRDRVNRMGGVGAWKEREKEQKEWRKQAERDEMEAERDRLKVAMEEARANGEAGEEMYEEHQEIERKVEEEEEKSTSADDDSFTMELMLKTLNVDLRLIRYDTEAQCWDG